MTSLIIKLRYVISLSVLFIAFFSFLNFIDVQTLIPSILGYTDLDAGCKSKWGSDSFYFTPTKTCLAHPGFKNWDDFCAAKYGADKFWDASVGGCRNLNGFSNFDDFCHQLFGQDSRWNADKRECSASGTGYFTWDDYCKAKYGSESVYGNYGYNGCLTHPGYNNWDDYCKGIYGSDTLWSSNQKSCVGHSGYNSFDDICKADYGSNYSFDTSQRYCIENTSQTNQGNQANQGTQQGQQQQQQLQQELEQQQGQQQQQQGQQQQQQGQYGGYNTPDEYCKGTYGSNYYYDKSRNVCAPTLNNLSPGSSQQGGSALGIDLTGQWQGTTSGNLNINSEQLACQFSGSISLDLNQDGKTLNGNVDVSNISLAGEGCDQVPANDLIGNLVANIFGSGFSGTVTGSGAQLSVNGQFTSDLMRGTFNGGAQGADISGQFTASRTG